MASGQIQPSISEPLPDFVVALRRSQILLPRQVRKIEVAIASGRYPRDPVDLATMLVRQGLVTQYQARCLLHGKQSALIVDRYVILDRLGKGRTAVQPWLAARVQTERGSSCCHSEGCWTTSP